MFAPVLLALAVLVGQAVPPAPPASPQELALRVRAAFDGAGRDVASGADFAESPGYREIVAALLALKPPDVAAQSPVPLDVARALAEPDLLRGTWVSVRGTVSGRRAIQLDPPVDGVTQVERTIFKLDLETALVCDLIGDPPPYKSQRDTVLLSGVFYRTVGYESDSGRHVVLPYVLARSMELVDTPASTLGKSLLHGGTKLFLGVALGLGAVFLFVWYLRRSAR